MAKVDDARLVERTGSIGCEAFTELTAVGAELRLIGERTARQTQERRDVERRSTTFDRFAGAQQIVAADRLSKAPQPEHRKEPSYFLRDVEEVGLDRIRC